MNRSRFFAAALLGLPLGAMAQTSSSATPPPPGTVVTETTEDLDPATGKVIRRTTRTYTVPGGNTTAAVAGRTTTPAAMPTGSTARGTATAAPAPAPDDAAEVHATDAQLSAFLRRKTAVATMTGPALLDAYNRFLDKVRADRPTWRASDWALASSVLSALNGRYEQLRGTLSLDDKINVRTMQAEYHALRTGRQLSDQVSDKL